MPVPLFLICKPQDRSIRAFAVHEKAPRGSTGGAKV